MVHSYYLMIIILTSILGHSLSAQVHHEDDLWIESDEKRIEAIDYQKIPLLEIEWSLMSPFVSDLSETIETLWNDYPWLNIQGIYFGSLKDSAEIARYARLHGLDIPIRLKDTMHESEKKENKRIKFNLKTPDQKQNLILIDYTDDAISAIRIRLAQLKDQYAISGRSLSYDYHHREQRTLTKLNVLNRPSGIAFIAGLDYLCISDTGNDRVIICNENGEVQECIGTGTKGNELGRFDETELINPLGIAVHPDSAVVYIADYGNARIVTADLIRMQTSVLKIFDKDGSILQLPSSPIGLELTGNLLTITLPRAQSIWTIDVLTSELIADFNAELGLYSINEQRGQSTLTYPVASSTLNGIGYTVDTELGAIYSYNPHTLQLVTSNNVQLCSHYEVPYDSALTLITGMKSHEGELYVISPLYEDCLAKLDTENGISEPYLWNQNNVQIGYISDICWSDDSMYLLDKEEASVYMKDGDYVEHIIFKGLDRLGFGKFEIDHFYNVDPINLAPDTQTEITIDFLMPKEFKLHPDYESTILSESNSEFYLENNALNEGAIRVITFPENRRNQLNLIGEVYLTEMDRPWKTYKRTFQIGIPIVSEGKPQKENFILLDMLEGVSSTD